MSLSQPISAVSWPGSRRVDVFALSVDGASPNEPHWLLIDPSAPGATWQPLGGLGLALEAVVLGDASELVLYMVGDDSRIWTNSLDPATNTWSGWQSNPDGTLHQIVVATS